MIEALISVSARDISASEASLSVISSLNAEAGFTSSLRLSTVMASTPSTGRSRTTCSFWEMTTSAMAHTPLASMPFISRVYGFWPTGPVRGQVVGAPAEVDAAQLLGLDEAVDADGLVALRAQLVELVLVDDDVLALGVLVALDDLVAGDLAHLRGELLVLDAGVGLGVELVQRDVAAGRRGRVGLDRNRDEAELEESLPRRVGCHTPSLMPRRPYEALPLARAAAIPPVSEATKSYYRSQVSPA